eukprot:6043473-Pyramimonas_sp.AAC.1
MSKARVLRMTIVPVGPPGYFGKQGPIRGAIEDLGLQVMRMRFCPADQICKGRLPVRASRPTYGDAHAKQQGNLHNL